VHLDVIGGGAESTLEDSFVTCEHRKHGRLGVKECAPGFSGRICDHDPGASRPVTGSATVAAPYTASAYLFTVSLTMPPRPEHDLTRDRVTVLTRVVYISSSSRTRDDFQLAAQGFLDVLQTVPADGWNRLALGVWTVRDLAGHASRALLTVEAYLDSTTTTREPDIAGAAAYYRAGAAGLADPQTVAERGRQAGTALGDDPAAAVAAMAERILPLIATSEDNARVNTPVGSMTLIGYLPSRTFELTVHSLDLLAATGGNLPAALHAPLASSLQLAAEMTTADGRGIEVLLALTGRHKLPAGFSVV